MRGVCLVPQTHVLAKRRKPLGRDDLAGETFVAHDQGMFERLVADAKLSRLVAGEARVISHSTPAIAAIAREMCKLAIVDPFTAEAAVAYGGVVAKPLREPVNFSVAVVVRDRENLSLGGRLMADALIGAFESRKS